MEGKTQQQDMMMAEQPQPDPANKAKDKTIEKELPLTEAEAAMDLSKMYELDLGEQGNYKTKIVQNRWQQQRNQWLTTQNTSEEDPKNGLPSRPFPDIENAQEFPVRKAAKKTMKSTTSPYAPFDSYYPLEDVIDTYMEIWYKDDSDSSSS